VSKSPEKLWEHIQRNVQNIRFSDFCRLVEWFGFTRKGGKGSHQTYFHPKIREILDLQPLGGQAKPYQIKQFLRLLESHKLEKEKNK